MSIINPQYIYPYKKKPSFEGFFLCCELLINTYLRPY